MYCNSNARDFKDAVKSRSLLHLGDQCGQSKDDTQLYKHVYNWVAEKKKREREEEEVENKSTTTVESIVQRLATT